MILLTDLEDFEPADLKRQFNCAKPENLKWKIDWEMAANFGEPWMFLRKQF